MSEKRALKKRESLPAAMTPVLLEDLRRMIEETRHGVAAAVNTAMTHLYWQMGKRIKAAILNGERAEYGIQILSTVSNELMRDYGRGYGEKNLRRMIQFSEVFPDEKIVVSLIRQLSWTHIVALIPLEKPLQRDFYAEMCRVERWSVRTLRQKIDSMLYERTALSSKPEELARLELDALREDDKLTPDLVFRDPYFLGFLGLKESYAEKDVEAAILRDMEAFILELGVGFAFMERQKRITLDGDDFYLDLLFFHRRLRRLVAIELKMGEFKPAFKGQMELYLRWLDKYERREGEEAPIGLILCAGKKQEQIELLELGSAGIHVAAYLTDPLPKEVLQEKLHQAIALTRQRLENQQPDRVSESVAQWLEEE